MTRSLNKEKVFFGWWTVLVTGTVSGLSVGLYFYGISALFKPIALELGLTRAATAGAAGLGTMLGGLLGPAVGVIADRFGPKRVILSGLLMVILGLTLMPVVASLAGFYLVWGFLIGAGVNLGLTIAIDKTLADWFVAKIGLATGAKFALIGLSSAVVLPSTSWLITEVGWRITCFIWAVILFLGFPLILRFVRNQRPEYYGLHPDGTAFASDSEGGAESQVEGEISIPSNLRRPEFSLRKAVSTKAYWILSSAFLIQMFIVGSFNVHCIPLLTEMGFEPIAAGAMMGGMLALTVPSRFLCGALADRLPSDRLNLFLGLPFLLQSIGIGAFLLNQRPFMVYVLLTFYGIAHGLPTPLQNVILSRYFGRKAFGSIFGTFFLIASPASLFSPVFVGWLFDTTGSYQIALILLAFFSLSVTLLVTLLKAPSAGS